MKKLISCLLAVMMLFSVMSTTGAFADTALDETSNAVLAFLEETDLETQDIAVQLVDGDETTELVYRVDGDKLHLVSRKNGAEVSHVQYDPTGVYLSVGDNVTLLRYATVNGVMQDIVKQMNSMIEQSAQNIPAEKLPSKEEYKKIVDQMAILAAATAAQEQKDAITLTSAAASFASRFKPEYILDVKEEWGDVKVTLRSDAYASAMVDAMDDLMTNADLAELVDRQARMNGGTTFAQLQQEWLANREATRQALRSAQSVETIGENGHYTSHFQMGEEDSAVKILVCDTDAWINEDGTKAEAVINLSFKDEDPFMVYEFNANPDDYWEKMTAGDSSTELYYDFDEDAATGISRGKTVTVIDGQECMRAEFGKNYMYMKGLNGGISSSVRETWTGKTRYELVIETADGQEATMYLDYYQDDDSLVGEMYTDGSDETVQYRLSRIDKVDIKDLSTSEKITEITAEQINADMEAILKIALPMMKAPDNEAA